MSDLVLGPVIGRIGGGGADISEIPVNFTSPSATGVHHVVDVPVPEGVTARVIVVGTSEVTGVSPISAISQLMIGGVTVAYPVQAFAGEMVVTGPTVVEVNRRGTLNNFAPSFVGTVYWWEEVTGNE